MKKIYLLGLAGMFALSANAQDAIRLKTASVKGKKIATTTVAAKNGSPSSVQQVNGNLICSTQYTAGTTMDLVFKFTQTGNTDEWIDMFTLTFPAGFTPNSSPNTAFPSSNTSGGAEAYNGVTGQDISWGANIDDGWGGITTTAAGVIFTVNVTIAPGTTGPQIANFLASGDTYTTAGNPTPGDLNGTATILDMPFSDMYAKFVQPSGGGFASLQNCSMSTSTIAARYINKGTQAESNISLNYSINGVAGTAGVYPGPLAIGDSITIGLGTYDFSPDGVYNLKAWSEVVGDVDMTNDTAEITFSNSNPVALTSAVYTNGVETDYEVGSVLKTWTGSGLPFSQSTFDAHSGTNSFEMYIPSSAPSASYTSINILPCMNVVSGEMYRISFWKKIEPGQNGQTSITTGTTNTSAGTITPLKAYASFTDGVWMKDSVDYTATTTGTRYFAIRGKGFVAPTAPTSIDIYIDDIRIEKIITTGIKTNTLADAITLFPNPSTGLLNINNVEATSTIDVYNVIGDKVYSNKLDKGNNSIDLSNLANGSYFVKINSNNNVMTKKVVISK